MFRRLALLIVACPVYATLIKPGQIRPKSVSDFTSEKVYVPKDCEAGQFIQKGSFGTVFSMKCPSGRFAVKKVVMTKLVPEQMLSSVREAILVSTLKSPYVLSGWLYLPPRESDRWGKEHYIAMPYYSTDLFEYMNNEIFSHFNSPLSYHQKSPLSAKLRKQIAYQVLQGVRALHSHGLMHLDIKPENILIDSHVFPPHCIVADLGSVEFDLDKDHKHGPEHRLVTSMYRPPEVLLEGFYTQSADLWSVACTLMELITGETLMSNATHKEARTLKVLESFLNFGSPEELTPTMRQALQELEDILVDTHHIDEKKLRNWMTRLRLNEEVSLSRLQLSDPSYLRQLAKASHRFWKKQPKQAVSATNDEHHEKKHLFSGFRSIGRALKSLFGSHQEHVENRHVARQRSLKQFVEKCKCESAENYADDISLIESCLCLDPQQRPSVETILGVLKDHPDVRVIREREGVNHDFEADLDTKFALSKVAAIAHHLSVQTQDMEKEQKRDFYLAQLYRKILREQEKSVSNDFEDHIYGPGVYHKKQRQRTQSF